MLCTQAPLSSKLGAANQWQAIAIWGCTRCTSTSAKVAFGRVARVQYQLRVILVRFRVINVSGLDKGLQGSCVITHEHGR
jgi:hypothetical protein